MALRDTVGEEEQQRQDVSNYIVSRSVLSLDGSALKGTLQNLKNLETDSVSAAIKSRERSPFKTYERRRKRKRMILSRGRGENQYEDGDGGGSGTWEVNNNNNNAEISAVGRENNPYGDYGAYVNRGGSDREAPDASSSATTATASDGMMGYDPSSITGTYGGNGDTSAYHGNTIDYSSVWGAGAASAASPVGGESTSPSWQSWFKSRLRPKSPIKVPSTRNIFLAIFLFSSITLCGMLTTAHHMEHNPEGTFANCCRVSLHTLHCLWRVIYNLYHCRLGDVNNAVFSTELEEDEYTDEEIERMRLRPGIERALDVEHRKALRKVGIEMNKIKIRDKNNKRRKGMPSTSSIR